MRCSLCLYYCKDLQLRQRHHGGQLVNKIQENAFKGVCWTWAWLYR